MKPIAIPLSLLIALPALSLFGQGPVEKLPPVRKEESTPRFEDIFTRPDTANLPAALSPVNTANAPKVYSPVAELVEMSFKNNPTRVRELLKLGTDPDLPDDEGRSAIMVALWEGHTAVVKAIIESGRSIDKVIVNEAKEGRTENTPLLFAVALGRHQMVDFLLQNGADVNALGKIYERAETGGLTLKGTVSPLGLAMSKFNRMSVMHLLDRNPKLDVNNHLGESPLHVAVRYGTIENLYQLLRRKPDLNFRNTAGQTAMDAAVEMGREAQVKALIGGGADINAADADGMTPVMSACRRGNLALLKLLDENGANLAVRTRKNENLLFLAAIGNKPEVVRYLLDRGVDPKAKSTDGVNAYEMINDRPGVKSPQVIRMLKDAAEKN